MNFNSIDLIPILTCHLSTFGHFRWMLHLAMDPINYGITIYCTEVQKRIWITVGGLSSQRLLKNGIIVASKNLDTCI